MGLDLHTPTAHFRAGSYSGVQAVRAAIIAATYWHLRENPPCNPDMEDLEEAGWQNDQAEFCIGALENEEFDPLPDGEALFRKYAGGHFPDAINYGAFRDSRVLAETTDPVLKGMAVWCDHSDCDGTHSPGEALDSLAALENVAARADRIGVSPVERAYWYGLRDFYRGAVERREFIRFR